MEAVNKIWKLGLDVADAEEFLSPDDVIYFCEMVEEEIAKGLSVGKAITNAAVELLYYRNRD